MKTKQKKVKFFVTTYGKWGFRVEGYPEIVGYKNKQEAKESFNKIFNK